MKTRKLFLLLFVSFLAFSLVLTSCSDDDDNNDPDPGTTDLTYVGSESCKTCHITKHNDWTASGHPYKFSVTEGNMGPVYPVEANNFQSQWLTGLTDGNVTWDNIAGVVGGYGWKARFVGTDGEIIGTAESQFNPGFGQNQINFFDGVLHNWSDYHPGDKKTYNYSCFKCHTTGGTQDGTWLDGVDGLGTFAESGIGCESCHGPGSKHIKTSSADDIDLVYEFAHLDNSLGGLEIYGAVQKPNESGDDVNFLCGTCHNRGYSNKIDSKGGYIKHHEQWDELVSTTHGDNGLTCSTCHDPHKRVIWDGDGITKNCTSCHSDVTTTNHTAGTTCIDCHMPYAAKSGTVIGDSGFEGDVRSHLVKITVDANSMFTEDGSAVKDDATRAASLSPEYTCLGCHNRSSTDAIPDKTLEAAVTGALNMHGAK